MTQLTTPLVSILLLTYNGERFLRQQLESLFAQDYPDFEVIVQDDYSQDNTIAILQEFAKFTNFHFHVNEHNIGFNENFALAVTRTQGEIIVPCDQDDIWLPNKLRNLVNALGDNQLVYSNSELIDEHNIKLGASLQDALTINFISGTNHRAFYYGNCVAAHNMMFKRELLNHIFPVPDTVFFDHWLAYIASRTGGIKYLDEKLVLYRKHESSVTVSSTQKAKNKSGLLNHLNKKAQRQQQRTASKIRQLEKFSAINKLLNKPDSELDVLITEYKKFDHYFFNRTVFSILCNNKNVYFAITRKNKFSRCIKEALGKIFYQWFPIS